MESSNNLSTLAALCSEMDPNDLAKLQQHLIQNQHQLMSPPPSPAVINVNKPALMRSCYTSQQGSPHGSYPSTSSSQCNQITQNDSYNEIEDPLESFTNEFNQSENDFIRESNVILSSLKVSSQ